MNAIELLKFDHEVVEGLFEKIEAAGARDRSAIFKQLKAELETHAYIEETIFYPGIQADGDEDLVAMVADALQDHVQTKTFLGEMSANAGDSSKFDPLMAKLIEDVRSHVAEEENQMFPLVEAQFEAATIDEWGTQMENERERFEASSETIHS